MSEFRFTKITEIASKLGWKESHEYPTEDSVTFTFQRFSDCGQDFYFSVTVDDPLDEDEDDSEVEAQVLEDVAYKVENYYEDFDASEEASLWLDDFGHGKNGAPHDMEDVLNDMKECEHEILRLARALNGKDPDENDGNEPERHVYIVYESDAWHSLASRCHRGAYDTLDKAIKAILKNGNFDTDMDMDYVKDFLVEHRQTPETGDTNYDIDDVILGQWDF